MSGSKTNLSQWIDQGHVVQFQAFGHAETNWTRWSKHAKEGWYTVEYRTFDGVWPSEVCLGVCVGEHVGVLQGHVGVL